MADALRQLAKTARIPVVLLSQLRRPQNVNDVPTMIDLKESGDIEAHAHVVLLLHAPTGPDGKPTGEDTIIVGKNRNGAKGPVSVVFSPQAEVLPARRVRAVRPIWTVGVHSTAAATDRSVERNQWQHSAKTRQ